VWYGVAEQMSADTGANGVSRLNQTLMRDVIDRWRPFERGVWCGALEKNAAGGSPAPGVGQIVRQGRTDIARQRQHTFPAGLLGADQKPAFAPVNVIQAKFSDLAGTHPNRASNSKIARSRIP